jgi:hypothetical protein
MPAPNRPRHRRHPEVVAQTSLEQFRGSLVQTQQQIDRTLTSLNDIMDPKQQDLRGAYDRFALAEQLGRYEHDTAEAMKRDAGRDAHRRATAYFASGTRRSPPTQDNPTLRRLR